MTVTPRKLPPELLVLGCIVALALFAFAAIRLAGDSWDARAQAAASEKTVGTVAAAKPKERVRYQATIENWRRFRAATDGR